VNTQVDIGKSINRNPKIAASEAVEMALKTGAIVNSRSVFKLPDSQHEIFYMTRRDYGLMVNGIDRLGHHDIEQHQAPAVCGRQFAGPSRRLAQG
jgi:hypothetical protein